MKQIFLLFIIFCYCGLASATDYAKVDKQSGSIPATVRTTSEIAAFLTRNLNSPEEKVRAIYFWIAHNIRYDVTQMRSNDYSYTAGERNILKEVLDNRQGVCQHYAVLFNSLCQSAGIQSWIIPGYTRQDGVMANLSHAWNAVSINGKFYNIDVTWAAGYVSEGKYKQVFTDNFFLIPPADFIKTHIPFDPIWQFSDNPITHYEFEKSDFSKQKIHSNFNFSDSIKATATQDTLINLIRENKRIQAVGMTNDLIRTYVYFNQQGIIQQKYNLAVKDFNKGVETYNLYIASKNKQFNGTTMDENKILELLSTTRQNMDSAENGIKFLNGDGRKFWESVLGLQTSIKNVKADLDKEDAFMKKYISTWKPLRMVLFTRQSTN
jgi:hypothetical protein